LLLAACADPAALPDRDLTPTLNVAPAAFEAEVMANMDATNLALAAANSPYRVAMAELLTNNGGEAAGTTLLQKDVGNKQLSADFVPGDPRRPWSGASTSGDDITFAIDQTADATPLFGSATGAQATQAILNAMQTWDNLSCSTLPLTRNSDFGLDIGIVAFQASGGLIGSPFVFADVQHAGFRDLNFSGGVLGVTFTFVFTSGGVPTDIDGNGKSDAAFREIYYDPSWFWQIGAGIDVESIALHEMGHGLSQGHFGNIVQRNNGSFDASPRAVMNAFYQSPLTALRGTDNGGHCSNWAAWPNN
jgi:hypothetical protein